MKQINRQEVLERLKVFAGSANLNFVVGFEEKESLTLHYEEGKDFKVTCSKDDFSIREGGLDIVLGKISYLMITTTKPITFNLYY